MAATSEIPAPVEDFLGTVRPEIRALTLRARAMLLERRPELLERVWPGWKMIGYGAGAKMGDLVVGLAPASAHVSLHFWRGTMLDDPQRLLTGTGKTGRHVRITSDAELANPALGQLIEQAMALAAGGAEQPSASAPASATPSAGYQVGASKTIGASLDELWRAWNDDQLRAHWLPEPFTVRKATAPKSMRITWHDGSSLDVLFYAKGEAKSQVTVDHRKLPQERIEPMKAYWAERLAALKTLLG